MLFDLGRLAIARAPFDWAIVASGPEPFSAPSLLHFADGAILVVALLLLLRLAVRLARRGSAAVWPAPPDRLNRLREEALAVAMLAYFCAALLITEVLKFAHADSDGLLRRTVTGNGAHVVGIVVCLLIGAARFTGGARGFLGLPIRRARGAAWAVLAGAVLGLGLCPLVRDATIWLLKTVAPGLVLEPHATIQALHLTGQPAWVLVMLWLGAAVIAPVSEEFFFRGLLQTCLWNVARSRWFAVIGASLAFGLVHYQQPYAVPALAVFGVILGVAYERTGSIVVPVLIHVAFNLKTLVWDALGGTAT